MPFYQQDYLLQKEKEVTVLPGLGCLWTPIVRRIAELLVGVRSCEQVVVS
jgi:Cu/Ag efflux pump CusA